MSKAPPSGLLAGRFAAAELRGERRRAAADHRARRAARPHHRRRGREDLPADECEFRPVSRTRPPRRAARTARRRWPIARSPISTAGWMRRARRRNSQMPPRAWPRQAAHLAAMDRQRDARNGSKPGCVSASDRAAPARRAERPAASRGGTANPRAPPQDARARSAAIWLIAASSFSPPCPAKISSGDSPTAAADRAAGNVCAAPHETGSRARARQRIGDARVARRRRPIVARPGCAPPAASDCPDVASQ